MLEISPRFRHMGSTYTDPITETTRRSRVRPIPLPHHAAGKRNIRQRLDRPVTAPSPRPVLTASNIHNEVPAKARTISCGGIGAIPLPVRRLDLAGALDKRLHRLKVHSPTTRVTTSSTSPPTPCATAPASTTLSCATTTPSSSTPSASFVSPTPPPPAISAAASPATTSRPSRTSSIGPGSRCGDSSPPTSSEPEGVVRVVGARAPAAPGGAPQAEAAGCCGWSSSGL